MDGTIYLPGDDLKRVVSFARVKGGIYVREECDGYYSLVLGPEQIEAFIAALRELAMQPEPETSQK